MLTTKKDYTNNIVITLINSKLVKKSGRIVSANSVALKYLLSFTEVFLSGRSRNW